METFKELTEKIVELMSQKSEILKEEVNLFFLVKTGCDLKYLIDELDPAHYSIWPKYKDKIRILSVPSDNLEAIQYLEEDGWKDVITTRTIWKDQKISLEIKYPWRERQYKKGIEWLENESNN